MTNYIKYQQDLFQIFKEVLKLINVFNDENSTKLIISIQPDLQREARRKHVSFG